MGVGRCLCSLLFLVGLDMIDRMQVLSGFILNVERCSASYYFFGGFAWFLVGLVRDLLIAVCECFYFIVVVMIFVGDV